MTERLSETTFRAWLGLNRAQRLAMQSVETALKQAGLPPLSWYDALVELENAGEAGLRPSALEKELMLPQYALSRLVERIAIAGYLRRETLVNDRRGQKLYITDSGRDLRRRMWPVYAGAVAEAFKGLPAADTDALDALLRKIT